MTDPDRLLAVLRPILDQAKTQRLVALREHVAEAEAAEGWKIIEVVGLVFKPGVPGCDDAYRVAAQLLHVAPSTISHVCLTDAPNDRVHVYVSYQADGVPGFCGVGCDVTLAQLAEAWLNGVDR
jgi:hypothetical protein